MPVRLEIDESESDDDFPSYLLISENGALIGRTSAAFDEAFAKTYYWMDHWPKSCDGLSLVSVETVAGDPGESERAGIGAGGFWLVPRVTGLARPVLSRA